MDRFVRNAAIGKSMENPQQSAFDSMVFPKKDFLRRGDRRKMIATNLLNNLEKIDHL